MPANLPPEYLEAEQRYREAQTLQGKLEALREMMALVPKHKGTERLRVELKRRWNKLNQEIQKRPKVSRASPPDHIPKEGAGQITLVGLPNSGKSTLLLAVTHAQPQIADYPFSTFKPIVGMMPYQDIQIQLVDLPPLWESTEPWVFSIVRNSDAVALVVDLGEPNPEESVLIILELLERAKIQLLRLGQRTLEPSSSGTMKKALLIGAKVDLEGAAIKAKQLQELYAADFPLVCISAHQEKNLEQMKHLMFQILGVVRVYTKKPGHPLEKEQPYILPQGSTVLRVAELIHHDFAQKLRYARVWGSAEFPGQRVERDHIIQDGDVLEFHV